MCTEEPWQINFLECKGPAATAGVVLIALGSPLVLLSIVLLALGVAELHGLWACGLRGCQTTLRPNILAMVLHVALLGLSLYCLTAQVWVGALFLALGALCLALHAAVCCAYTCGTSSPPRSPHAVVPTPLLTQASRGSSAPPLGAPSEEAPVDNPFVLQYGILPGTSTMGYTIFIPSPTLDAPAELAPPGPYKSLRGGDSGRNLTPVSSLRND